ncbi:glycosyltransferase family protein [Microcoleus sp. FACHB-1515]|uniref:tetratricopeptide repeat-containing glycosyltransferase family protein n=1 Tax=Cyanophyceae TaxID=3028117 RepID=UPI00168A3762|nr:tetratricopeptide repeat-containing glycosyltransferase family protein [Microcoleus sp. FACHB-1515]MBD2090724.1 glycosyltransferase family protein [Microcoleus sp. FACHB-1515]
MLKRALEQYRAGQLAQAAQICQQLLQQQPDHVGALHLLGLIAARQGDLEKAIALYDRVIHQQPQHLEAHNNLGIALMQLGRLAESIAAYRQALKFAPRSPEVLVNLGNALQSQGNLTESIHCYEQALAHNPKLSAAHKNLAHVLRMQGQTAAAIVHHQSAIALAPNDGEAHFGYAFTLLINGDLQAGFAEYEWRWRLAYNPPRQFPQPRWDGAPLNGKTLLLWAEQGFGDTLQFVRYVLLLANQGRIIVECQPSLRSLLTSVPGIAQVISQGEPLPPFDWQAPLLSLPHLMKTAIDTIPARVPYLHPPQSVNLPGSFKIGIAWAGDPKNPINQRRSCPVEQFLKLRSIPGVTLYSLQKDQAVELPEDVIDLSDRLRNFADTAAIVAELDLVISIDTALAHLAGALGKAVWVVLPFSPDWRWLLHRSDSPWYPTMRLFRQPQANDWDSVFAQVAAELQRSSGRVRSIDTLALHCATWTEAAINLALQLQRHCRLKLLSPPNLQAIANPLNRYLLAQLPVIASADCPVLHLLDRDADRSIAAPVKIGWILSDAPPKINDNDYSALIASVPVAKQLEAQGIKCVHAIDPGIDPTIFHPVERSPHRKRFAIFAAGEPSDLVLAAFDRFSTEHPEAQLLTSWPIAKRSRNGIDSSLPGLHLGVLKDAALAQVFHSVDAVVAIDSTPAVSVTAALSCGLPVVITADFDWVNDSIAFVLPAVTVEGVVDRLRQIRRDPATAQAKGLAASRQMQDCTWERQTLKLLSALQQSFTAG